MSKILSKSAVFIATLALLAAPVTAGAQPSTLTVTGGGGGVGGTTGGTQVTITPNVGIKDPATWAAQLNGQSWGWTIDSDAQLAIFQDASTGFNALNFTGGIGGAGNADQAAKDALLTGGFGGNITFTLDRDLTGTLGASSFIGGAGGAGGLATGTSNMFGGNGNLGGAVDVMLDGKFEFTAALTLKGGAGGASGNADNGGTSGAGGAGGDVEFVIGENAAGSKIASVDVDAGAAGANGVLTNGVLGAAGKGGDVYFTVNGATEITGTASFTATAGGASADAAADQTSTKGAAGGNVVVELNAKTTTGALDLTAGAGGASGAGSAAVTAKTDAGGAGGAVDFTIGSNAAGTTIASVAVNAGAGGASALGAAGSDAGEGGAGGKVDFTVNGATTILGAATFTAGAGANSAVAGAANAVSHKAGAGGDISIKLNAATTFGGLLTLAGNDGGNSGNASGDTTARTGAGGAGGAVDLRVSANAAGTVFKGLTVTGGTAGAKGTVADGAGSGDAGNGGAVNVNLLTDVTIDGALALTSGAGAAAGAAVGGNVKFDAAGQTVTVTGVTTIGINTTNAATAGTVFFIADKFVAGGAVALGGAATGTPAEKATAFTFDVNELQFVGATSSLTVTNPTLPNAGQGGISIGTLTIGGVVTDVVNNGQSIAPVSFTATAAAGTHYKFGGHLQVIGLGHSVITAANLGTISDLTFVLSDNDYDGKVVLSADAPVVLANNVNIAIETLESGLNSAMEVGDTFTLINTITNQAANYDSLKRTVYSTGGLITDYAFALSTSGTGTTALDAKFLGEVLVEGAAHSVAMAAAAPSLLQMNGRNLASDLVDAGTLIGLTNSGNQIEMLFGLGAGADNFELNSEIKSNHFNLNIGPALNMGLVGGTATIGAFFEAGWANYDIINENFALNDGSIYNYNGEGKAHYFGGGVLAGVELNSGFHADASMAFGRVTNEFNPDWLDRAGFELKANYFGLHASAGYLIAIDEKQGVDVYGKLLWSHQFEADATTDNGQLVQFDAFNSVRTILGADYNLKLSPEATLSAGLAWEYQFETEQSIHVDNMQVIPANFKGHTGLLNLGLDIKASDNVSLGLNLQGALGQRDGFSGNLNLGFSF